MARYTVSEVAKRAKYSPGSIRNWTAQFTDHLSEETRPPQGEARAYSDHDLAVMLTIARLKREKRKPAEIRAALDSGELVDLPPEGQETRPAGETPRPEEGILMTEREARLSTDYARLAGQLDALELERDMLRDQWQSEREALLAAEIRATKAETKLEIYEGQPGQETPPEAKSEGSKRPWWKFWQ